MPTHSTMQNARTSGHRCTTTLPPSTTRSVTRHRHKPVLLDRLPLFPSLVDVVVTLVAEAVRGASTTALAAVRPREERPPAEDTDDDASSKRAICDDGAVAGAASADAVAGSSGTGRPRALRNARTCGELMAFDTETSTTAPTVRTNRHTQSHTHTHTNHTHEKAHACTHKQKDSAIPLSQSFPPDSRTHGTAHVDRTAVFQHQNAHDRTRYCSTNSATARRSTNWRATHFDGRASAC